MNRHQRRAQQSAKLHPDKSFTDLLSKESLERLKPFIAETVQVLGAQLARQQLAGFAPVLTRISVLEDLVKEKLGETDQSLAERQAANEDAALGYVKSEEPAKHGDYVRVALRGRSENDPMPGDFTRAIIRRLNQEPHQYHKELENGIVGMKSGETKMITLDTGTQKDSATGEEKKLPNLVFEVKVERISYRPTPEKKESSDAHPKA